VWHRGYVKNGVIILDPPVELPEGAEVIVRVVSLPPGSGGPASSEGPAHTPEEAEDPPPDTANGR